MSPASRTFKRVGRKWLIALVAALLGGGLVVADRAGLLGSSDAAKYDGKTFHCPHVVDGDTIDIAIADGKHSTTRIRLWGVDTPETVKPNTPVQHFGPEASAFTKNACLGKDVRVVLRPQETRDKYGRLLAYVYLPDGTMLNRKLVQDGYGYADPGFPHDYSSEFDQLMKQAIKDRRGLWKDAKQSDLPPYLRKHVKLPE